MKKPNLYLLSILDFDGVDILNKVIISFDNLEDKYFTQFWYLQNYLGVPEEYKQYMAVFKKMTLETPASTEIEMDILHSIKILID